MAVNAQARFCENPQGVRPIAGPPALFCCGSAENRTVSLVVRRRLPRRLFAGRAAPRGKKSGGGIRRVPFVGARSVDAAPAAFGAQPPGRKTGTTKSHNSIVSFADPQDLQRYNSFSYPQYPYVPIGRKRSDADTPFFPIPHRQNLQQDLLLHACSSTHRVRIVAFVDL